MKTLGIQYPVKTLDGRTLLPPGAMVDDEVVDRLLEEAKAQNPIRLPVLGYSSIRKDMLYFAGQPPYEILFAGEQRMTDILTLMEKVSLPRPLLEILEHFRTADFYTYRHMVLVFALSALLARELLEDPDEQKDNLMASPTHDVGKLAVPVEILRKADQLTPSDRQVLKHHTAAGYILVGYYLGDFNALPACVARDHHERRDGSGYPSGDSIDDLLTEIVIVSDIYDALLSPRPYRPAPYETRTALEVLTLMADKGRLRWDIVETLILLNRKRRHPAGAEARVSRERRGSEPEGNTYSLPSRNDTT